jgi:trigger factor
MQVTETLSEGLKRGFTVVIPAAQIEDKHAKRLAELGRTLSLPGFRPGKVPPTVVRKRYGTAVQAEVLEESVNEATSQVLSDRGLRAATQPKVDVVSLGGSEGGAAKDLEFKVELELMPEIAMPDFAAMALTRFKATPADPDVEKALGEIAARAATLEPVSEVRAAAQGDVVVVDYAGAVDGEAFEGGTGKELEVEIGGSGFIPGFAEQLEGITTGESRSINVTFPESYGVATLAGKPATFAITATALKQKIVPPVDDALAEKLGAGTLAELRELIVERMQRDYDQISRLRLKRALLDELAKTQFPVPQGMVEAEFDQIWARVEADRKAGQVDEGDVGKDEDTLKAEYRAIAERRVRLGLLLAEIGRSNGITVGQEEINRAMRQEAARYPGQEQQVLEFFRKNPQAQEGLRGPIFEEKAIDFVLELAKVDDQNVSAEELAANPDNPA